VRAINQKHRLGSRQKGGVLLLCLILMIAVTLLGLSSMNTTLVENRIVSNTRNQTLALGGAESALEEAQKIVEGKAGENAQAGLSLKQIQANDSRYDPANLNGSVSAVQVKLTSSDTASIPLWGKGAVTENAHYLDNYGNDRVAWWNDDINTAMYSQNLSASNTQAVKEHYSLAGNPRYVVEKGAFIADDLNPNALAEYRGRVAFVILSRSVGRTDKVESTLQATVLTRYR
jgi:Tfp pilus assembly protein PilX